MVRQYVQVTDAQRSDLVRLIHEENCSIAKAAKITGIPYDNAKAINRTYLKEQRVNKINYRLRYQKNVRIPHSLVNRQTTEYEKLMNRASIGLNPCQMGYQNNIRQGILLGNNQNPQDLSSQLLLSKQGAGSISFQQHQNQMNLNNNINLTKNFSYPYNITMPNTFPQYLVQNSNGMNQNYQQAGIINNYSNNNTNQNFIGLTSQIGNNISVKPPLSNNYLTIPQHNNYNMPLLLKIILFAKQQKGSNGFQTNIQHVSQNQQQTQVTPQFLMDINIINQNNNNQINLQQDHKLMALRFTDQQNNHPLNLQRQNNGFGQAEQQRLDLNGKLSSQNQQIDPILLETPKDQTLSNNNLKVLYTTPNNQCLVAKAQKQTTSQSISNMTQQEKNISNFQQDKAKAELNAQKLQPLKNSNEKFIDLQIPREFLPENQANTHIQYDDMRKEQNETPTSANNKSHMNHQLSPQDQVEIQKSNNAILSALKEQSNKQTSILEKVNLDNSSQILNPNTQNSIIQRNGKPESYDNKLIEKAQENIVTEGVNTKVNYVSKNINNSDCNEYQQEQNKDANYNNFNQNCPNQSVDLSNLRQKLGLPEMAQQGLNKQNSEKIASSLNQGYEKQQNFQRLQSLQLQQYLFQNYQAISLINSLNNLQRQEQTLDQVGAKQYQMLQPNGQFGSDTLSKNLQSEKKFDFSVYEQSILQKSLDRNQQDQGFENDIRIRDKKFNYKILTEKIKVQDFMNMQEPSQTMSRIEKQNTTQNLGSYNLEKQTQKLLRNSDSKISEKKYQSMDD
eukprot:403332220